MKKTQKANPTNDTKKSGKQSNNDASKTGNQQKFDSKKQGKLPIVDPSAQPLSKPRIFGNWTGKLPVNILNEHIQREKWDKPSYRFKSTNKGHCCWITLKRRNNKTGGWDQVEFTTYDHYSSEQLAKHSTATYTLHRLLSDRNLHSLLPPPMRDLWQKFEKEKREADPDVIPLHYAANPFEVKNVELEPKKVAPKREPFEDYPTMYIPKELRDRLEGLMRSNLEHVVFDQEESQPKNNYNVEKVLSRKGFRDAHVQEALQYCKTLNEAVSWLCIHCPEDDLPPTMRPTDNKSMIFSNLTSEGLKNSFALERLMSSGASRLQCARHLSTWEGNEYLAAASLCKELAGVSIDQEIDSTMDTKSVLLDEIATLEAIYPDLFKFEENENGFEFKFPVDDVGNVIMVISHESKYPFDIPGIILADKLLPAYIKLAVLQKVVREAISHLGSSMLYTILDLITTHTPMVLNNPPSLVSLYQVAHPIGFGTTFKSERKTQGRKQPRRKAAVKSIYDSLLETDAYQQMLKLRQKLPAYAFKDKICNYLENNQVAVICGETGSGKSTQVGQFILERLLSDGNEDFHIICTQPRRISAISLADRVAAERGDIMGNLVGYSIRGESKQSSNTRLIFCTTGILFRMIQNDPELSLITHVIVDEVHERGIESDFLLILLRDLLLVRKDLKVILMSATIESSLFCDYFKCEMFEIPGFAHPVTDIYLESVLQLTGYQPSNINLKVAKKNDFEDSEDDTLADSNLSLKKLRRLERDKNFAIDYGLITATVNYICNTSSDGAILIFLPGIMEIKKCIESLKNGLNELWCGLQVFPLHSNLTSKEQNAVFKRVPVGIRKIVVSTNIAETSVTIDDVVYVVDTGRVKEMGLQDKVLALTEVWASAAACKQRRGRAGRVKPGYAYKLFTKTYAQKYMNAFTKPEILRLPLEQICLQIKSLGMEDVKKFLSSALTPPPMENIEAALKLLENLQAVDSDHNITPLGKHISQIPADIRIAKMLIYGSIFKCLDTVLTVASYVGGKSPLVASFEKREEAASAHSQFKKNNSDHLTVCDAFTKWQTAKKISKSSAWSFCESNFISMTTMESMVDLRKQLLDILIDIGYATKSSWKELNVNSSNERIVRSVLLNGLELAGIKVPSQSYVETMAGSMAVDASSKDVKYFADGVLFQANKFEEGSILVFGSKVKTSKTFVRDCSVVPAMALALFGGNVTPLYGGRALEINGIRFQAFPRNLALITGMRKLLNKALADKFNNPASDILNTEIGELCYTLLG